MYQTTWVSIPGRSKFYLLHNVQTGSGACPTSQSKCTTIFSPWSQVTTLWSWPLTCN